MKVPKKPAPPIGHPPYNVNGEGGRPKEYTPEFIEAEAEALEEWMQDPSNIYFKKFAFERGYSYKRLSEFAAVNRRFKDTLERAREWQEIKLVEGGLLDEFNANLTKFVLINNHGWAEKTETKLSGDAEHPLAFFLPNCKIKEVTDET